MEGVRGSYADQALWRERLSAQVSTLSVKTGPTAHCSPKASASSSKDLGTGAA